MLLTRSQYASLIHLLRPTRMWEVWVMGLSEYELIWQHSLVGLTTSRMCRQSLGTRTVLSTFHPESMSVQSTPSTPGCLCSPGPLTLPLKYASCFPLRMKSRCRHSVLIFPRLYIKPSFIVWRDITTVRVLNLKRGIPYRTPHGKALMMGYLIIDSNLLDYTVDSLPFHCLLLTKLSLVTLGRQLFRTPVSKQLH